jgi:hypothetical protein
MAAKLDDIWKDLCSHKTSFDSHKVKVNATVENQVRLGQED